MPSTVDGAVASLDSAKSAIFSRSSAPRICVTCSTAATTRAFFVGKWCSWAPRETPARSLTSVVEVPE